MNIKAICQLVICFLHLGIFHLLDSQAAAQVGNGSFERQSVTDILPPAPNAYELTRYSGLPVNHSTGAINTTIPIGTIRNGKTAVPISLRYNSGNGITLDQFPSRTGMSWALDAGGVITRTVYGNPDETSTFLTAPSDMVSNTPSLYQYFYALVNSNVADSQPDIFNFSFNGINGKFIFERGTNGKIVLLNPSALKIESNFNGAISGNWTFRITDEKGVKYYFGGNSATEKSRTSPLGQSCGKNYDQAVPTAWYLKSIVDLTGNEIKFDYVSCNFDYSASVSESIIRTPLATLAATTCQPCPTCPENFCPLRNEQRLCVQTLSSQGRILKSISSKYQRAEFRYGSRQDLSGDSLLTHIQFYERSIKNGDTVLSNVIQTYALSYVHSQNNLFNKPMVSVDNLTTRPFLSSVRHSSVGMQDEVHRIEYYDINRLAARLSFAQDYWGFFNGKNNLSLVPQTSNPDLSAIFTGNLGDRNPDGSLSHFGLLSKITYPSKGTDSVIYEPNTYYGVNEEDITVSKTLSVEGTGTKGEVTKTLSFTNKKLQKFKFVLSCVYSGSGIDDQIHQGTSVYVYNASNTLVASGNVLIGQSKTISIDLPVGDFRIELVSAGQAARGYVGFSFWDGIKQISGNFITGGVRIQKKISNPLIGPSIVKTYLYAGLSDQTKSSAKLFRLPSSEEYYSELIDGHICQISFLATIVKKCHYKIASNHNIFPLESFSGGHIFYTDVIELNGPDWNNGGTLYRFMGEGGSVALQLRGTRIPGVPVGNFGFEAGTPIQESQFITVGGTQGAYLTKPVREVFTSYNSDIRLSKDLNYYVVRKNWDTQPSNTPSEVDFEPFDVARYTLRRKWIYADTITEVQYNLIGADPVITKRIYQYSDTNHLQLTQIRTMGSDGGVNVRLITFPLQYSNSTGSIGDMKQNHLVSFPIESIEYKELGSAKIVLSGEIIKYRNGIKGTIDEVLKLRLNSPIPIASFKLSNRLLGQLPSEGIDGSFVPDNRYSPDIIFGSYDSYSNPLELKHKSGPSTVYLWGYGGQYPIAKIDNATYAEVTAVFGSSSTTILNALNAHNVSDATINTHMNTLRSNLGNSQVTSYTYSPLVGMTSMTDPRGITEHYQYDGFQRLKEVLDFEKNVLTDYQYHYRP